MKQALVTAYVFTAAAKTIDLSSIFGFDVKRLYAIINITANQVIYAVGIPAYGLASITGSTLTLVFDTTTMSDGDSLLVVYDTVNTDIANAFVTKNTDGTNSQSYTASGEAKVLTTPLTNSSIVKAQLQDNSGSAVTLGQKVMASSLPITIASDQSALPVSQSGIWSVGRTWDLSNGTDSIASVQSGTWTTGRTWTLASGSDSVSAIQSGTWNIGSITGPVALPTGAATASAQGTGNSSLASILANQTNGTQETQVTNFPTTQAVTQSGTWTVQQGTPPWTQNLTQVAGSAISLGQKVETASLPVVIASDQSAIPVSQSGSWTTGRTWNLSNSTDSIASVQSGTWTVQQGSGPWTQNLTQVGGSAISLSQKTSALSLPVVLASDQSQIPVSQSGSWTTGRTWTLASGTDSVSAIQSGTWTVQQGSGPWTQNLTQVAGSAISLGQKTSAASLPVVIASDQSNLPANITQVGGAAFALGQAAAASSLPVVTQPDVSPSTQNITAQDTVSSTASVANGQSFITGTPSAGSTANFSLSSFESIEVLVTGTWTGTLVTEVSMDGGTTWLSRGIKQNGITYIASSFTANFAGGTCIAGMTNFRIRSSAVWTGSATVKVVESINETAITVLNPQMLRDGTTQSILNTIKAASTAPVAADTAIVMAMSPNVAGTQTVSAVQYMNVIDPSASTPGSAIPARATLVAGSDGTNARAIATDTSGNVQVVGNVASGASDSGNPVKVGAKFNSTLPAITNGQRADLQANQFGELAIVSRNQYKNIHGVSAGTLVKTGAGRLHTVVCNNQSGGNAVTIYDGTSTGGTLIATITNTGSGPATLIYDCEFATGLFVVTASASNDVTLNYQ